MMPRARSSRLSSTNPTHDEVRVPTVHFVETATGDDITVGKIKQSGRGDAGRQLSGTCDGDWQVLNFNVAALLHVANRCGSRRARGQVKNRFLDQLGVNDCVAVGHGAGERVPAGVDVFENRSEAGIVSRLRTVGKSGSQAKQESYRRSRCEHSAGVQTPQKIDWHSVEKDRSGAASNEKKMSGENGAGGLG